MISGSYWTINHFKYMFAENIITIIVIPSKNNSKHPLKRIKTTHRDNHTLNQYIHKNNHSPDLFKLTIQHRSIYIKGITVWGRVQIAGISVHLYYHEFISRFDGHDGVWSHQPYDCLLNRPFRLRFKKNIKVPRHWPLLGEFTGDRQKNDVRERKALASY